MNIRWLFVLAGVGAVLGIGSAVYYARSRQAQPPMFNPASNPYANGIYATGIVQSDQDNGVNLAIYPEVSGVVQQVSVREGRQVKKGDMLLMLDGSVQRATVEQLQAQARAAQATLDELKAQPRPETLSVSAAQVDAAAATLKLDQDQFDKLMGIYDDNPSLISKDQVDNARNAVKVAQANLEVTRKQYQLSKAGAWHYEVQAQTQTQAALEKAYRAANAQLDKYTIRAPMDGTVLSVQATVGSYVSTQGTYDTISGGNTPLLVMGGGDASQLRVRCYIDEILIQRLSLSAQTPAQLAVRGTSIRLPLEFISIQPYVSPKIELSSGRAERVDLRVLPVLFRVKKPANVQLYPGQLVDVYIGAA
jgi:HlyD family secretion protein